MDFLLGFRTLEREQEPVEAEVHGAFPSWLQGTLLRNGPGSWQAGRDEIRHWFDGFAMLHRFHIEGGHVHYRSRFLRTPDREEARQKGRVARPGFATDPCRSLFQKVASLFVSELGANANINVTRVDNHFLALTETPMAVEFDGETLATVGLFDYDHDGFQGQITSAHPVRDRDGLYNFTVRMGRRPTYRGYRIREGAHRQLFATHDVEHPGYLHSCGLTSEELTLVEGPLLVEPLKLLWRDRPYIHCYQWQPERGTRLVRLQRADGRSQVATGPAMFVFHQVNSFYDGYQLCVDVLAYPDPKVIDSLTFERLGSGQPVPTALLQRLRVDGDRFTVETLSETNLELPRLAEARTGMPYRYVYGIHQRDGPFYDALAKVDVTTGASLVWHEEGCYPGEPVPVPEPGGAAEDSGVLLSAVLDTRQERSFLLVLQAATMEEIARAYVPAVVPFGFHGGFYAEGPARSGTAH